MGPVISRIGIVNLSKTSGTISWTTDVQANARIDYGTTTSYGSNVTDATSKTIHGLYVTALTANTTYHYKLTSVDALGNTTVSPDYTFTTKVTSYKPGDVNSDGSVGAVDLSTVLSHLDKASYTFAQGNADGDLAGVVDNADKAIVDNNYGT